GCAIREDGIEELADLVVPSHGSRNADPSTNYRENGKNHQRGKHDPRRFVYAMGMVIFTFGDHYSVAAGGRVHRRSVIVQVGAFFEVLGAEKRLEPQPEHVERCDAGSDQADEPEEFADG